METMLVYGIILILALVCMLELGIIIMLYDRLLQEDMIL